MRVLLLNHYGGGFADFVDVPEGATIAQLFASQVPEARPEDYLIRCNRLPVSSNQLVQDGDRVTITPLRIEGAV